MVPGEYAVLYSSYEASPDGVPATPYCDVFSTLSEAERHAEEEVKRVSTVRCRIYSDAGLGGPPIREIRGAEHRGESEISATFRRWAGSVLFFAGLGLIALDWMSDFRLTWPATIGARAMPVGLILLLTEAVIVLSARRKERHAVRRV